MAEEGTRTVMDLFLYVLMMKNIFGGCCMVSVLFVCLGNICRSPMAEAIFRHKVKEQGLEDKIRVDSAGTGSWHVGKPPHEGTQKILTEHQIDFSDVIARQLQETDTETFDYIIGMDSNNMDVIKELAQGRQTGTIAKFLDYVPEKRGGDVPDPYFTGNFEEVYHLINEGCERLLAHIREKENV
mgnify:FL=1